MLWPHVPKISCLTSKLMLLSSLNISPCLTWVFTIDAYLVSQLPASHPRTVFQSAVSKASKMQTWLFGSVPLFLHVLHACSANRVCLTAWEALGYLAALLNILLRLSPTVQWLLQPPELLSFWTSLSPVFMSSLILWSLPRRPASEYERLLFSPALPLNIPFSMMFPDLLFLRRNLFS